MSTGYLPSKIPESLRGVSLEARIEAKQVMEKCKSFDDFIEETAAAIAEIATSSKMESHDPVGGMVICTHWHVDIGTLVNHFKAETEFDAGYCERWQRAAGARNISLRFCQVHLEAEFVHLWIAGTGLSTSSILRLRGKREMN